MNVLKFFNPVLFIILIVCFFLPFVQVSCGNKILVEASGMDIVTGTDYSEDKDKDENETKDSDNYRYIMIIAFGITLVGLVLSAFPLIKSMDIVTKIFNISMAVISLFSFILLILYVYLTDRSLKDTKNVLEFKLLYGFFVLVAFYLITAVVNVMLLIFSGNKPDSQKQVAYYPPAAVNQNKICGKCGMENISDAAFCKNCGSKLL
ncbi:MAG: zinc ribbon domain-containing protein [Ignavibacteria bacterium]|nr:zinc ribbon domain-containing protein [Ignavibacteria bacterium]